MSEKFENFLPFLQSLKCHQLIESCLRCVLLGFVYSSHSRERESERERERVSKRKREKETERERERESERDRKSE